MHGEDAPSGIGAPGVRRARRVRDRGAVLLERLYAAGFSLVGSLDPQRPTEWASPGGQRVLCVAPHPDDECVGCGGTLIRHAAAGDEVSLVVVTDGAGSRARGLDPPTMRRRRRTEVERAAQILGVTRLEILGCPEHRWDVSVAAHALGRCLEEDRPDVIYGPSRVDFHPEHVRVARAVALALRAVAGQRGQGAGRQQPGIGGIGPTLVRVYPVQVPLTAVLTNLVSDVSAHERALSAALAAHETQWAGTRSALRWRRYAARRYRGGRLLETFWQMSVEKYVDLHDPQPGPQDGFRGMRPFPLTDVLAYLTGRRARRRLLAPERRGALAGAS